MTIKSLVYFTRYLFFLNYFVIKFGVSHTDTTQVKLRFNMFYRYACPVCESDLRDKLPVTKKFPWYKFVPRITLLCPHCGAEIEKRFARLDSILAASFFAVLAGGGFIPFWRLVKVLIPMVLLVLCLRFLAGLFFTVYIRLKSRQ